MSKSMGALWPLVLRSLRGRPLRTVLTGGAVALGVAVILGVQITLSGLDAQARAAAVSRAGASDLDVRSPTEDGLTTAQVDTLRRLPGVARAEPLYEKRATARAAIGTPGIEATLVSVSSHSTSGLRPITVTIGRLPRPRARDEVAIDTALANALVEDTTRRPVGVGDHILLTSATGPDAFRVVGITSGTSGGAAFSRSAVFVSDDTLHSNFPDGLRTPLVALELTRGTQSAAVAAQVAARLGGAADSTDPRADIAQPLDQLRPMLVLITVLSLIIGGGVTANSVSLSVLERRREIGLLRAAGAGSGQVYRIFMAEGVVCAAGGALTGVIAGVLLGAALIANRGSLTSPDMLQPPLHVDPSIVVLAALLGMLTAFLGGSLPALAAARIPPLAAIRPASHAGREPAPTVLTIASPVLLLISIPLLLSSRGELVAVGAAVLLTGVCAALPLLGPAVIAAVAGLVSPVVRQAPLAAANLIRRRNRTALTTAGLVVSVAAAVAVSALTGGAQSASDRWIGRLLVGNAIVHSGVAQPEAIQQTLAAQRGVQDLSPIRYFTEIVRGQSTPMAAIDPAFYARHNGFDVVGGDRALALRLMVGGPSVLIPRQMANDAALQAGDTLVAGTGTGGVRLDIVGVVDHSFPGADGREAILIGQRVAITNFGERATGFNDLQVVVSEAQMPALATAASRFGMQATSVDAVRASAQSALQHSVGLLFALSGIAVAIAMLAVVNTLLVTARYATRELGLLRAVGMARGNAVRLLLTEAALLAATGAVIGVGAGSLLSIPLLQASSSNGFSPQFVFPGTTAAMMVVTVTLAAILAALVPSRRAAGASIVSTIRYE